MSASAIEFAAPPGGFSDAVEQSQQTFRAVLQALSTPGSVITCAPMEQAPRGLGIAVAAALLTLADLDTPVWIGPGFDATAVSRWLQFHTGAPLATRPDAAAFVLLEARAAYPALEALAFGSDEAPEGGATVLIQSDALDGPPAMQWRGPGIRDVVAVKGLGLGMAFWRARQALEPLFPRGIDLLIGCGPLLLGCPRSTRIEIMAGD